MDKTDQIKLENILLEYGIRVLTMMSNKENPTLGELVDKPKEEILKLLNKE